MSRLAGCFQDLARRGETALVTFVTAGDPDATRSLAILEALARGGSDILEVGVPFSDPTADGPTIQRAAERALAAGMDVAKAIDLVRRFRAKHAQPVVLFGYYNPFLQYGLERLVADAREAGADGFLVVDLPPEEATEFKALTAAADLDLVYLLAPTSGPDRIAAVGGVASGFVYYVSRTGVTGSAPPDLTAVATQVSHLREAIGLPVCVGFGIGRPDQAAALRGTAEGVVVGTALVDAVERLGKGEETLAGIEAQVRALKAPLRGSPEALTR